MALGIRVAGVAVLACGLLGFAAPAGTPQSPAQKPPHKVIAYFFHITVKCKACEQVRMETDRLLRASFAEDLRTGRLAWQVINVQESAHTHFVKDYNLHGRTLVLAEFRGSKQVRYDQLRGVWNKLRDMRDLDAYVTGAVRAYLSGSKCNP